MKLYCCECGDKVDVELVSGAEIYPHRLDLRDLPFWRHPACGNYVGCHHKTKQRTKPLGNIPNKEMRLARQHIHKILDPIWKTNRYTRSALYRKVSVALGYEYHTAEIKTIEEARKIYQIVSDI